MTPKFPTVNIEQSIADRIAEDPGNARSFFGMTKNPDEKWMAKNAEAIKAAQILIDLHIEGLDVAPLIASAAEKQIGGDVMESLRNRLRVPADADIETCIRAYLQGQFSRKVIMLCPMNRPIDPMTHWAKMATLRTHPHMGYDQESNALLVKARNNLANRFLRSEAEWAFWVDDDVIPPFGNSAAMFQHFGVNPNYAKPEYMQISAFERLRSRGKSLISGIVGARNMSGKLIIQPEVAPKGEGDTKFAEGLRASGPRDEVKQVGFVGTGCTLVHRSVFLDIIKRHPELDSGNPNIGFQFFGHRPSVEFSEGEDVAFSELARECGHTSWIDCSVWCAHVGSHSFFPNAR